MSDTLRQKTRLHRWRLMLGDGSEQAFGGGLPQTWTRMDQALSYLYGREYGARRNVRGHDRHGASLDPSQLTVPEWINLVHELFPRKTIERIEKDALERYQLEEMVTNPELLRRAQPSMTLLKAVLNTKHLMNEQVLKLARDMARKVIEQLMEKLSKPVQAPFLGTANRNRRSYLKIAKNFDAAKTIRRNLKHFDRQSGKILIQEPIFYSRIRRRSDQWQLIILVDQSGSMADSVIYSAISAAIFCGCQALKTHLIAFDTSIIDLSDQCADPLETLMKVQLGGGTDIGQAVAYASTLVAYPRRTIVVLISDFYEGAEERHLLQLSKTLVESGVILLGLAALDERAEPVYNRQLAQRLANVGAHMGAMTPGELAQWVAEKVK